MKLKCISISFFLLFISLSYQADIVSFNISFTYFNITNKGVAVSAHDNLTEIFPVFPFCITPSQQCFNISLDNTIYQTWIPGQLLSKFFNKTYIPHPTDNVVSTTKGSTGLLDSNYVGGMFVKAEVSPYKSNNSFVFALMNEGNLYQKHLPYKKQQELKQVMTFSFIKTSHALLIFVELLKSYQCDF